MVVLSKSDYVKGVQCLLWLWKSVKDHDSLPKEEAFDKFIMDQGYAFENLCKEVFDDYDFQKEIEVDDLKVRSDFFKDGVLVECKSGSLKDLYFDDLAFQKYVFELAGIKINSCLIAHPNKDYVKDGDLDVKSFVEVTDVSKEVDDKLSSVKSNIELFKKILEGNEPDVLVDCKPSRKTKFDCPAHQAFKKSLPAFSVFDFVRTTKKDFLNPENFYKKGFVKIADVTDDIVLTDKQKIQRDCVINDKVHISLVKVRSFLTDNITFPLFFLDFETINPVIPIYDGCKPGEIIPFQYDISSTGGSKETKKHSSFLGDGINDPRKELVKSLIKGLGELFPNPSIRGSVIVYSSFEKTVLKNLAKSFPEHEKDLNHIISRLVDLEKIFKNFDYYNPLQKGKSSIKYVLPALNKDFSETYYDNLEVSNGAEAIFTYFEIMKNPKDTKLREALIKYCSTDTLAMRRILLKLEEDTDVYALRRFYLEDGRKDKIITKRGSNYNRHSAFHSVLNEKRKETGK